MLPLLLLLIIIITVSIWTTNIVIVSSAEPLQTRIKLPQFSLGPAPFPENPEHLDFELFGSAELKRGLLQLTRAKPSQAGSIWSKKSISTFGLGKNWQVDLRFQVGGSPNLEHFGDGFSFYVAKERGVVGKEALGGPDAWSGLAIFFDTFKNDNFRLKKHPYIYGKVSSGQDQVQYKSMGDGDKNSPGCHVPFRDSDPKSLATTVARITYLDRTVSVILRPRGSVDWVKCFEIKDVDLPPGVYFGVAAMTGNLVDNHFFVQLSTYGNIELQPFSYAVENNVAQMPDMWHAMRESGRVAREFADWEDTDSFSEDLHWSISDKVVSHLNDDYDDPYVDAENEDEEEEDEAGGRRRGGEDNEGDAYKDYDESDEDEEDDDEEEDGDETDEDAEHKGQGAYGPPSGKQRRRASSSGKTRNDDDEETKTKNKKKKDDDPEREKLVKDLEKVFKNSNIGKELTRQHEENAKKMEKMHAQLQREMQAATDHLHQIARDIRRKEHELSSRLLVIGEQMKVTMINPFVVGIGLAQRRGWWYPFLFLVALLIAIALFGYNRYRKFMKSHVL